jgi:terminase large subunit-like protein
MMLTSSTTTISAQPGPQTEFLRSPADICIYGGAAGGGKTVGLLLEPLRHVGWVANFTAVFFRRTTPQITAPGALWDESLNFYRRAGGTPHLVAREWRWPCGGKIKFSHLQFASTVYDWQGAQIALICFDELTHFTKHQFFYMISRNRSTCGVRPYIRATCNPDADAWVADFLAWWIDPESGLAIPERAGVLRSYVRVSDEIVWADRPEDLRQYLPRSEDLPPGFDLPQPISVTFIPAGVFDNRALLQVNPEYLTNLLSLPLLERERLLGGTMTSPLMVHVTPVGIAASRADKNAGQPGTRRSGTKVAADRSGGRPDRDIAQSAADRLAPHGCADPRSAGFDFLPAVGRRR